ncbi:MAG: GNAT family N-acetyltransferase [Trueperaceae bacterium]
MIRVFTEQYTHRVVEIWNLLNSDWPRSAEEVLDEYRKHDPTYLFQRFVAEVNGQVVGVSEYDQSASSYHPQKFLLELFVHPDVHGQGIGRALYHKVLESIQPHQPLSIRVQVRETSERALRFFSERDFVETKRAWVSVLDMATCDLRPYMGLESTLTDITFTDVATLQQKDPEALQKFHGMFSEVRLDVPRSEPATPISYEFFVDNVIHSPDFDARLFLFALVGEKYIGFTGMYPFGNTQTLDQWLTGIRRDYRKRNIALALKVRSVQVAKANGYTSIRTDNDSSNTPMLAINDKLGFKRGATNLSLLKTF